MDVSSRHAAGGAGGRRPVGLGRTSVENVPEFPIGLFVGAATVLATLALNGVVLVLGGNEDWHRLAVAILIPQLPLAVIEGVVLGFTVGFLARVKPEMLGWLPPEESECSVDPLPSTSPPP